MANFVASLGALRSVSSYRIQRGLGMVPLQGSRVLHGCGLQQDPDGQGWWWWWWCRGDLTRYNRC